MISALDDDLCDCFVEYGETTAEMFLMFTFVLLGSGLIWSGLSSLTLGVAAFAVLALAARPVALLLALAGEKMEARSRKLIVWFGPRGLSTLLLALIPAFDGIPGSERLFAVCGVVVLLSIVVHGGSITLLSARPSRKEGQSGPTNRMHQLRVTGRVSVDDLDLIIRPEALTPQMKLADVRSNSSFMDSNEAIAGAVRIDPEDPVRSAQRLGFEPSDWIALFCT